MTSLTEQEKAHLIYTGVQQIQLLRGEIDTLIANLLELHAAITVDLEDLEFPEIPDDLADRLCGLSYLVDCYSQTKATLTHHNIKGYST